MINKIQATKRQKKPLEKVEEPYHYSDQGREDLPLAM